MLDAEDSRPINTILYASSIKTLIRKLSQAEKWIC